MLKDFNPKSGAIGGAVVGVLWLTVWSVKKLIEVHAEDKKLQEEAEALRKKMSDIMENMVENATKVTAKFKEMSEESDRRFHSVFPKKDPPRKGPHLHKV